MICKRLCLLALAVFISVTSLQGQGAVVTSLQGNTVLQQFHARNPNYVFRSKKSSRAVTDTLQLPFFDEFVEPGPFPNPARWTDNQAYVNSTFPLSPPSFGVATLDNLNSKGNPYKPMTGLAASRSDSLTSQPINLKTKPNSIAYIFADSIYFSFFFQCQGRGDMLDNSDSLFLEFKDTGKKWQRVWSTKGLTLAPFKQILVGPLNVNFFSQDFQFRFVNWTKHTGNMNQWHIDYVRLNSGRFSRDTVINDLAFNKVPTSPLRNYQSMPYDHFKADYAGELADSVAVVYRNTFNRLVNTAVKFKAYNRYGQVLGFTTYANNNPTVLPHSDTTIKFKNVKLDTLKGENPLVRFEFKVSEGGPGLVEKPFLDTIPKLYNVPPRDTNNTCFKTTQFSNYFAYDDGSAEGGFGLDYASLPNGPGYAAVKFRMNKADTLRGVHIFFNQSVADLHGRMFDLIVWKRLSEPPATNTANDVIAYRINNIEIDSSFYRDTINGFYTFIFDTTLLMPQGDFYIGWQQNTSFILNVGFDNNYRFNNIDTKNPNLFFNLLGYWDDVSPSIMGAVMMRPIVGKYVDNPMSVKPVKHSYTVSLYPNPGTGLIQINTGEMTAVKAEVTDLFGRTVYTSSGNIESIDIRSLAPGNYWVKVSDARGASAVQQYIKTE